MQVKLPYGHQELNVQLPRERVEVLLPRTPPRLASEETAFRQAVRCPMESKSLMSLAEGVHSVCIVISDWTRPTPNHLLVPWLINEMSLCSRPPHHITILVAAGTHEPPAGAVPFSWWHALPPHVDVLIHDAREESRLVNVGRTNLGDIRLHEAYVQAQLRVVTGFIEPHFFAGFSGGAKAVLPGIAALDNILRLHGPEFIAHRCNTWFARDKNPTHEAIVAAARLCPPHFLVNVTLDRAHHITGFFSGDWAEAHRAGCEFCARYSSVDRTRKYPVVLTTNGGYPLDQNLYQTVKGMSAASRIAAPGGDIVIASACEAGIPSAGNFKHLLLSHDSLEALVLASRCQPAVLDQWEAQAMAAVLSNHRVHLYSQLAPETVRDCFVHPVTDLSCTIIRLLDEHGPDAHMAVMPLGPLAVPH